tara:strand:- start:8288 stop:9370 length:1083 start_codon:yes stop_codon:yes gene_type:complete
MMIKLNQPVKPNFVKLTEYLSQINNRGWYTNFGPLHQQFTQRLEAYLGVDNLLLVSNGTLALQVAYKVLNVKSAVTTPFSYVATASSLMWQSIETSFSDVDKGSYNLCPEQTEKSLISDPNIDTVVATHVYGNPCKVDGFETLAVKHNVNIIYDAAHAFGVKIDDKSVLSFGDASTLSFHATKVFHTVEGGAIVFKNKADFEHARRLINFGQDSSGNIIEIGINAKLNEYQCAVGLTLLDEVDSIINHRVALFNAYRNGLQDIVEIPYWHPEATFNGAYMPIKLENIAQRILVEEALKEHDIQSRQYFSPSLDNVFEKSKVFSSINSQELANTVLCLPLHFYMSIDNVSYILKIIRKVCK